MWICLQSVEVLAQNQKVPTNEDSDDILINHWMPAEFPGGQKKLSEFIVQNLKYPNYDTTLSSISGTIWLSFYIEVDGSLTEINIKKGLHPDLEKEACRVISIMPKWIPAQSAGKKTRMKYTLPIKICFK